MHRPSILTSISPLAVRAQLRRILTSEIFDRSRRMQRFLEFIVEETLAGRAGQLCEYAVAIAVFDRGPDFDPAVDPIVRNDARRLRLKLFEFHRDEDAEVCIEIPKGGYVPVFRQAKPREQSIPSSRSSCRIAVLPFDILSSEEDIGAHGRALCMSLTAGLTNLEGLEAVAHGYVLNQPFRDAIGQMNVTHVIQGSLMKSRLQCRVIINLIGVVQGTQLWAREYDFEMNDVFAAQTEICSNVRREVTAHLGLRRSATVALALAA